jgi:hypothetical protein
MGNGRGRRTEGAALQESGVPDSGAVTGIGEDEAGTVAEGGAGGSQGVAAGGDVVHEVGLAEAKTPGGACDVMLFGGDRPEIGLVAGALVCRARLCRGQRETDYQENRGLEVNLRLEAEGPGWCQLGLGIVPGCLCKPWAKAKNSLSPPSPRAVRQVSRRL